MDLTEINLDVDSLKRANFGEANLKETNIKRTSFMGVHLE